MSTDKTLADVQPGGRVRLGDRAERVRFEKWMTDVAKIIVGSSDPYPAGLERDYWRVWQAALSAQPSPAMCKEGLQVQPSPGGQDALDCIGRIEEAIEFRVPHDIYASVHGELAELKAALAARQPVGDHLAQDRKMVSQPVGEPVAYLDLGAGGYMDVGTDLSDRELAALPKGRHMLGIIGTYGVDGYKPAQAVDLGQIWQQAFDDTAHSYRRNKSRMWVLQMMKERAQELIDSHSAGGQP